jgi:hypothetical protein
MPLFPDVLIILLFQHIPINLLRRDILMILLFPNTVITLLTLDILIALLVPDILSIMYSNSLTVL